MNSALVEKSFIHVVDVEEMAVAFTDPAYMAVLEYYHTMQQHYGTLDGVPIQWPTAAMASDDVSRSREMCRTEGHDLIEEGYASPDSGFMGATWVFDMSNTDITTTAGDKFSIVQHIELARLIYIRMGRDLAQTATVWRVMLGNSATDDEVLALIEYPEHTANCLGWCQDPGNEYDGFRKVSMACRQQKVNNETT